MRSPSPVCADAVAADFRRDANGSRFLDQKEEEKYIVCNGDEGDPGAFMDRSMMEGDRTVSSRVC